MYAIPFNTTEHILVLGFKTYEFAEKLAEKNENKVIAVMDDTVPGNIILIVFIKKKRHYLHLISSVCYLIVNRKLNKAKKW